MDYNEHAKWVDTGFDFTAVEDPVEVCMEDLSRIVYARKLPIIVDRHLAAVVLAWGSEKALGPSEGILEKIAIWIMSSRNPNDIPLRAMCFARLFAGPGAGHGVKYKLTLGHIATITGKKKGWVDSICRNLKATLYGGQRWWPNQTQQLKRMQNGNEAA